MLKILDNISNNFHTISQHLLGHMSMFGAITLAIFLFLISYNIRAFFSNHLRSSKKNTVIVKNYVISLKSETKPTLVVHNKEDIKAIAGEDELTTQLDLARAYIEMNQKQLAKQILDNTIHHGNAAQQQEARLLLSRLITAESPE